jgi:hypothetical protein
MSDHPIFEEAARYVLNPDAYLSREAIGARFSRLSPADRVQFLRGANATLASDPRQTKQSSNLWSLTRSLEATHKRLLAAER